MTPTAATAKTPPSILIVDDDPMLSASIVDWLELEGWQPTETAPSVAAAVAKLAAGVAACVVVMDWSLADGGAAGLQALQDAAPRARVGVWTGAPERVSGITAPVLDKASPPDALSRTLAGWLAERDGEDAAL